MLKRKSKGLIKCRSLARTFFMFRDYACAPPVKKLITTAAGQSSRGYHEDCS